MYTDDALQEIVVTAQKRAQNVQDVPIAITAITGEQMAQFGMTSAKDIQNIVPGVILDSTSSGGVATNLTVRGISQSDYSANQESPNAIYIDEIYLASSGAAAFPLYDMDRVEVLQGPQGTLFGRNATGGLASFYTARPTKDFQSYAEVGFWQFNEGFFEGAVSGPISDRVRVRLSGRDEENSGWWQNSDPGQHNTFETRFRGARAQIDAEDWCPESSSSTTSRWKESCCTQGFPAASREAGLIPTYRAASPTPRHLSSRSTR
jgi:iron complex outermembrane recepter protein